MKIKNETVRLVALLFTFCAVVALVLAGINMITKPVIAEVEAEKTRESLLKVCPSATDFAVVEYDKVANPNILEAYELTKLGQTAGYGVLVSTQGFGGEIKMMVGVANNGRVLGVSIINLSETPGLGTKAADSEWLNQFVLKTSPYKVVKGKAEAANEVVAVTSATVTSKAVTAGVEAAIAFAGGLQ
ncbi:MAG: RnfABCDGE type electron transport complex subunit G [Clostridia bacterium]|nr:RnfABCDGE type electron transport complex subunit G [Clostridia bacterium]MBR5266307.1 RnfABCDGE type electron transport complex subunit G [Clostridia bacterium]